MRYLLLLPLLLCAETRLETPSITSEHRAKFWRLQTENIIAQTKAKETQLALQESIKDLTKDCGEKFDLVMGQDGEPICSPKKEVKEKSEFNEKH